MDFKRQLFFNSGLVHSYHVTVTEDCSNSIRILDTVTTYNEQTARMSPIAKKMSNISVKLHFWENTINP